MIYQYEMACKEAGMSEEAIAEIRRMFDADYKKLKRLNNKLNDEDDSLTIFHLSAFSTEEGSDLEYDPEDPNTDVEGSVIQGMLLDELDGYLGELEESDRHLILTYFSFKSKAVKQTAAELGCSERYVSYRRDVILKRLQKKFDV